jgi:hypothetical protein
LAGADAPAQLNPIDARQIQIEDQQIVGIEFRQFPADHPVIRDIDGVTLLAQPALDGCSQVDLIFDKQYAHRSGPFQSQQVIASL